MSEQSEDNKPTRKVYRRLVRCEKCDHVNSLLLNTGVKATGGKYTKGDMTQHEKRQIYYKRYRAKHPEKFPTKFLLDKVDEKN